jgi:hypothetical protein
LELVEVLVLALWQGGSELLCESLELSLLRRGSLDS